MVTQNDHTPAWYVFMYGLKCELTAAFLLMVS